MSRHDEIVTIRTSNRYGFISTVCWIFTLIGVIMTINVYTGQYSTVDPLFDIQKLALATEVLFAASAVLACLLQTEMRIAVLHFWIYYSLYFKNPLYFLVGYRANFRQAAVCLLMAVGFLTVAGMNGSIWYRIGHHDDFLRITPNGTRLSGADAGVFKTMMVMEAITGVLWFGTFVGIVAPSLV